MAYPRADEAWQRTRAPIASTESYRDLYFDDLVLVGQAVSQRGLRNVEGLTTAQHAFLSRGLYSMSPMEASNLTLESVAGYSAVIGTMAIEEVGVTTKQVNLLFSRLLTSANNLFRSWACQRVSPTWRTGTRSSS